MDKEHSKAFWLILCEYASVHSDQTMTVVRGGLHEWERASDKFPFVLPVGLAGQFLAGTFPEGKVPFIVYITGPGIHTGTEPAVWGNVIVKDVENSTLFTLPVKVPISEPGRYTIEMIIGVDEAAIRASTSFDVKVQKESP